MTFLNELEQRIGQQHVLTGQSMQQYLEDWRGRYTGTALAVSAPTSEPASDSVRFIVPVHSPVTIRRR